jgi:hypothetical protein
MPYPGISDRGNILRAAGCRTFAPKNRVREHATILSRRPQLVDLRPIATRKGCRGVFVTTAFPAYNGPIAAIRRGSISLRYVSE